MNLRSNGGDPKLLIHSRSPDGTTTFVDSSGQGHTVSVGAADVAHETDYYKWRSSSILFDGDSGYLTSAYHTDWDIFAETNFNIDLWVKHDTVASTQAYISQYENAENQWMFCYTTGSGLRFYLVSGNSVVVDTDSAGLISDTDWHHVAVCKVGDDYGTYLDGQQVGHTNDSSTDTLTGALYIGYRHAGDLFFDGYMDEIALTHDNRFGAAPVAGLTDTILVPNLGPYRI